MKNKIPGFIYIIETFNAGKGGEGLARYLPDPGLIAVLTNLAPDYPGLLPLGL